MESHKKIWVDDDYDLKNSSLCIQKVHQIQLESINEFLLILIVNDFYFLLIFFW